MWKGPLFNFEVKRVFSLIIIHNMGMFSQRLQEAQYSARLAGRDYFWVVINNLEGNLWSRVQP